MTRPRIGWYVHHHGSGHLSRLLAIAPHLDADLICFSSLERPDGLPTSAIWIRLDRDDTFAAGEKPQDPTAGGLLHWAPLYHAGHRRRLNTISALLDQTCVAAFVVDVSVEVALLVRLLGIPVVLLTQPGSRDDEPHTLAFRSASTIIAPWPRELLEPAHLADYPVVYVGGISRFEGRPAPEVRRSGVLVLAGSGGTDVTHHSIADAAASMPETEWTALGIAGKDRTGWVADPWGQLASAEVVVAFAGQNSIADLAAAGARAVIVPQARPFDEQNQTATALDRAGLAVLAPSWPEPQAWPELIGRASALTPRWSRWQTDGAAARAAAEILATAEGR